MANEFVIKKGFVSKANSVVSGSLTVSGSIISPESSILSGSFSGSFQGDGSSLTGVGAFPFSGSAVITGSLTITGSTQEIVFNGATSTNYPKINFPDSINIGNHVTIHSGTIIGSDGFGFVTHDNNHEKIPQVGKVIIGDNVEIGANCAIDRATIGVTSIGEMTKIDNLAHIAHNVIIGKGCLMAGAFAIAGSSEVGDFCSFGGQVGIGPHVKIGPRSSFAAKSGITKSLKGGKVYAGFPAREIRDHNNRQALLTDFARMRTKLGQLIKNK